MADGDGQLKKGLEELDADDEDPGPVWGRPKDIPFFLKEVVQVVLLFGSKTWVLKPRMERTLDSF